MTARLLVTRAGPLATIQDAGRFGMLAHGISASGPMDRGAYALAGRLVGSPAGAIEMTTTGLALRLEAGACHIGFRGGAFVVRHNGTLVDWPGQLAMSAGDTFSVTPGARGNYGYLRFDQRIDVPSVMGSIATNSRAGLGGLAGRALVAGDHLDLVDGDAAEQPTALIASLDGPIRVTWGLHAELFGAARARFLAASFRISAQMDRMGVRLEDRGGVFANRSNLALVSDAVVPGDIQILGDGTPIVLMRDHQPTGGYPRIATIISADLDRFAQLRPGSPVAFTSVSVEHAHYVLRDGQA